MADPDTPTEAPSAHGWSADLRTRSPFAAYHESGAHLLFGFADEIGGTAHNDLAAALDDAARLAGVVAERDATKAALVSLMNVAKKFEAERDEARAERDRYAETIAQAIKLAQTVRVERDRFERERDAAREERDRYRDQVDAVVAVTARAERLREHLAPSSVRAALTEGTADV